MKRLPKKKKGAKRQILKRKTPDANTYLVIFFIIKYAFMKQLINGVEFRLIHIVVYFYL